MDDCLHRCPRQRAALLVLFSAACLVPFALASDAGLSLPQSVQHLPETLSLHERALQGEVDAQVTLADYCFSVGDYTSAVTWYGRAASNGNVGAQLSLASAFKTGRGVKKDLQAAHRWYQLALTQGSPRGDSKPGEKVGSSGPKVASSGSGRDPSLPPTGLDPPRSTMERAVQRPAVGESVQGKAAGAQASPLVSPKHIELAAASPRDAASSARRQEIPMPQLAWRSKRVTQLQRPDLELADVPLMFQVYWRAEAD